MRVAPVSNHADRRARLVDRLATESLTSLIVTSQPNIAYLTGFFGSAGLLLVTGEQLLLIVDGRYTETAEQRRRRWEALNNRTLVPGGSYEESLADHVERSGGRRVGFESADLTVAAHADLSRRLLAKSHGADLVSTDGIVERLRAVKDDWEIATLRDAGSRLSE